MKCYFGFRGSGKTLNAVIDVHKMWRKNPNLLIVSNYCDLADKWGLHPKTKTPPIVYPFITPDDLEPFFSFCYNHQDLVLKHHSVLFIDECNMVFSSRFFKDTPKYVLDFLAQSRHFNCDCVFTTQHPCRVDKVLRELSEDWLHCSTYLWGLITLIKKYPINLDGTPIQDEFSRRVTLWPRRGYKLYDTNYVIKTSYDQPASIQSKRWNILESYYTGNLEVCLENIASLSQSRSLAPAEEVAASGGTSAAAKTTEKKTTSIWS